MELSFWSRLSQNGKTKSLVNIIVGFSKILFSNENILKSNWILIDIFFCLERKKSYFLFIPGKNVRNLHFVDKEWQEQSRHWAEIYFLIASNWLISTLYFIFSKLINMSFWGSICSLKRSINFLHHKLSSQLNQK